MLERDCNEALSLVQNISTLRNTPLKYEVANVKAWANLGLDFVEKNNGEIALQTHRLSSGEKNKLNAVRHLKNTLNSGML